MKPAGPILPDVWAHELKIVFCGTAPGNVSAAQKAYYAHPQNRFWPTLARIGLTPHTIPAADYNEVLRYGLGLTDLAKTAFGMDKDLPRGSLGHEACAVLQTNVERYRPRLLAFTSLTAGRRFLGPKTGLGPQERQIGETKIWVLPSPSPAAAWHWKEDIWTALAQAARKES